MYLKNTEKNKREWVKKEKRIKATLIGIGIAVLALILIIIFFRTQVWAIVSNIAILVGLFANLIVLFNASKKEG